MTQRETSPVAKERTEVIQHIIKLCGFAADSTMVSYIDQEQWETIYDVVTYHFKEIDDMNVIRDNGKFDAKPMLKDRRRLKCFLLYYRKKCDALVSTLIDEEVLMWKRSEFNDYVGSAKCQLDMAVAEGFAAPAPPNAAKYDPNAVNANGGLTAQEFRRGIKRDKSHYADLKDDKYFNSWNRGFVATAHTHHTHFILDEKYCPVTPDEKTVFKEIQVFMFAVLEEHLKTSKGKALVSMYEHTHDAQMIYAELKKHAQCSTAAQLSGDTLLQYITTPRFPGNWRGTSYDFVLHWNEQVVKYERLEVELFPPKHKLRMLQNTVGEVRELAYVKQIGDQDVARGRDPLDYETYIELLLSACSTYDKKIVLPGKTKRAVYASITDVDNVGGREHADRNDAYEMYNVDTDVSDIMVNAGEQKSSFIPREEWNKLSDEEKERLIAKRRQERLNSASGNRKSYPSRQANVHDVGDVINLDDIVDYTVMKHDVVLSGDDDDKVRSDDDDTLLAYMVGSSKDVIVRRYSSSTCCKEHS